MVNGRVAPGFNVAVVGETANQGSPAAACHVTASEPVLVTMSVVVVCFPTTAAKVASAGAVLSVGVPERLKVRRNGSA